MALSRRLRFEVLRRDGYTCRYCGAMAPDVPLTVDHVIPVALGGSDEPANLVTACQPCNAGKSSVPADAPIVEDVDATALRWKRAMEHAAELRRLDRDASEVIYTQFLEKWNAWTVEHRGRDGKIEERKVELPEDWRDGIDRLIDGGLDPQEFERMIATTMKARRIKRDEFSYFMGVGYRILTDLQEAARRIVEAEDAQ